MRKKHVAPDHDSVNDNKIHRNDFGKEIQLNTPIYKEGDLVEYRYNSDEKSWLPAMIIETGFHNVAGHCIYKIFSTEYGYREVHEAVLYPIE